MSDRDSGNIPGSHVVGKEFTGKLKNVEQERVGVHGLQIIVDVNRRFLVWCRNLEYTTVRLGAKLLSQCRLSADPREKQMMIKHVKKLEESWVPGGRQA